MKTTKTNQRPSSTQGSGHSAVFSGFRRPERVASPEAAPATVPVRTRRRGHPAVNTYGRIPLLAELPSQPMTFPPQVGLPLCRHRHSPTMRYGLLGWPPSPPLPLAHPRQHAIHQTTPPYPAPKFSPPPAPYPARPSSPCGQLPPLPPAIPPDPSRPDASAWPEEGHVYRRRSLLPLTGVGG